MKMAEQPAFLLIKNVLMSLAFLIKYELSEKVSHLLKTNHKKSRQ